MEPRSTVSSSERRRAFSSSSTRSCSLLASSVGALASAGEGRVTSSLGEVVVAVVPVAVTAAVSTTVSGSKTSLGWGMGRDMASMARAEVYLSSKRTLQESSPSHST